jgi:MFS family permease
MKHSRPLKFGIGLFAGLCASLFPRLVAELTTPDTGEALILFSTNYLLLSLVFSIFIGVVITIFEWDTSRSPKDVFMSALAIPAILSGALNTTATVSNIKQLNEENDNYQQTIQSLTEIPTLPPTALTPVTWMFHDKKDRSWSNFSLVSEAYAAKAGVQQVMNYNLGVMKAQPYYMVVLGQANTKQEAEQKAAELREKTPVSIFRNSNNTYIITTKSGQQKKSTALQEAIRLKTQQGLQPSLQQIQ